MLGMIPGNGHPYSWSAIINGYDPAAMAACPYPVIKQYLGAQPAGTVRIPGAQVTHLWTDNPAEALGVAAASLIPNLVARPEDVIGHVDAVFVATDDGFDHVRRARPFVEAGLPVFVDKPLALTVEDLRTFIAWEKAGARLLSSSGLRYAPELAPYLAGTTNAAIGDLRWLSGVTTKSWERYGIHLLEPIARVLGPGFESVRLESNVAGVADPGSSDRSPVRPGLNEAGCNPGHVSAVASFAQSAAASAKPATPDRIVEVAHLTHRSGVQVSLPVISDGGATFGTMHLCGTAGQATVKFTDTYTSFRGQLVSFIDYVRNGRAPYPFAETVEYMAVLIAGIRSRSQGSRRIAVADILAELHS
ncbi:MAG: Gfo/Idh/MocA family oxidoreductase [Verrucomicrobia bacterium]|nr:Gfo/Idh/MocA family oxidoreductase [Verrucomicrobiota bacterium]